MSDALAITIDARTRQTQRRATDPAGSAWVSANAGTGKTYVLSRRVMRLLLAGTDPATILCLTFTKAAAAEMASRIFTELARWTGYDDARLTEILTELEGRAPDTADLAQARRLFARALETPGGLKIQTIHAFCEGLLHQFPFEAGVAGHFEVAEETAAAALIADARRSVVARAAAAPAGPLGRALADIVSIASDQRHDEALQEAVTMRRRLRLWLDQAGGLAPALDQLRAELGLVDGDSEARLRAAIVGDCRFKADEIARLVAALGRSTGKNDRSAAERLAPYLDARGDDQRREAWLCFVLTTAGDLRKPGTLVSRSITDGWPGLAERIDAEFGRLEVLLDRIAAARLYEASVAVLTLAEAVIDAYDRAKAARGLLDFDDLIDRTAALLARAEAADWVRYKLDRGLDHILVDEAQDTSPAQWQVIQALAEEFFAGRGAATANRTVFAVGDEKQSIYSFQGALPAWFSLMRRRFGAAAAGAGKPLSALELYLSFRSTDDILTAVDTVFRPAHAHTGLASEAKPPVHQAARQRQPGRVVLWPQLEPPVQPDPPDWATPLDRPAEADPALTLADRIATTVAGWLDHGERLEATGTPIRPGDILILCRRRGLASEAINRALKANGIAVAGADRLALASHIAVMDLLALADVMLLPEDDLALATVLKSPLIAFDEETLFGLAHNRHGSLWAALEAAAESDMFVSGAYRQLAAWRGRADYAAPYEFFARILGPDGMRRAFAGRLGPEVDDILDEFLARTLAYERTATPSLHGFVGWMRNDAGEVTRDTELLRDEVRVMTVHGAKGLEAPIVFLVDDGSAPAVGQHDPRLVVLDRDPDQVEPAPLVWLPSTRDLPDAVDRRIKRSRERAREEYRRLFYVAMTRARDRLYICGIKRGNTDADGGWYGLARSALAGACRALPAEPGAEADLEWRADWSLAPHPADPDAARERPEPDLPDWIGRPSPPAVTARRLAPSSAPDAEDAPVPARAAPANETALKRGALAHSLLQALPEIAPAERRDRATTFLALAIPDWPADERDGLRDSILAVLDEPAFAPLFAPGSRAEVGIAGRIADGGIAVSGRIDRVAVTPDRVLIVDYKTNRPAPAGPASVPPGYVRQLALYRALLAGLYPDRTIAAALLWTDIPALMPIPATTLDAALAAATGRLDAGAAGS